MSEAKSTTPLPKLDRPPDPAEDEPGAAAVFEEAADSSPPLMGMPPGVALSGAGAAALAPVAASLPLQRESDKFKTAAVAEYASGNYPAAIDLFRRVLNLNPDSPIAHHNLAIPLWRAGRAAEAELHCRRAVALDRSYVPAHKLLAELLRRRGDAAGALALRVERTLVRIAASLKGNVIVSPPGARLPPFDVWCPMLSLPRLFGTRAETIPAAVPYLAARAANRRALAASLGGIAGPQGRAGVGRQSHPRQRFPALDRTAPLFRVRGISWVGLQVGPRAANLAALPGGTVIDLSPDLHDMAETAGAIVNLDLVIAVDIAVVHLAGALAKPAWVMLPFSPD